MLEVYDETGVTKTQVCEWHERVHDWHKTAGFFFMRTHALAHLSVVKIALPSTV
jgi:hypothetical protein